MPDMGVAEEFSKKKILTEVFENIAKNSLKDFFRLR